MTRSGLLLQTQRRLLVSAGHTGDPFKTNEPIEMLLVGAERLGPKELCSLLHEGHTGASWQIGWIWKKTQEFSQTVLPTSSRTAYSNSKKLLKSDNIMLTLPEKKIKWPS